MEHSFFSLGIGLLILVSAAVAILCGEYMDRGKQMHGSVWGRAFGIPDSAPPAWASRWWAKALFFPYPLLDFAIPLIVFSPFIILLLWMLAMAAPFMLYDRWKERKAGALAAP